jgi:KDO2-lipid IV(A) lauroyltransferase
MKIKQLLEIVVIIILSFPVAILPHKIALKAGEVLGLLAFYFQAKKRKVAVKNIETIKDISLPPNALNRGRTSELLAKEAFKNIGKSFVEVIKIYYGFGKGILKNIEIIGIENYHRAKSKGKGVILITGHCGNWELLALSFGLQTGGVSGVAREQKNPFLNRLIEHVRVKHGNRIIYKKGALRTIISELRQGRNVGILIDQAVFKNKGYIIDFLGRPSGTIKSPALIARKTGAPVIPAFINRNADRHIINIYPEVKLSQNADLQKAAVEDTARFMGFIEAYIKEHPTEWYWVHRKWKNR